jgi:hypothetical protein
MFGNKSKVPVVHVYSGIHITNTNDTVSPASLMKVEACPQSNWKEIQNKSCV